MAHQSTLSKPIQLLRKSLLMQARKYFIVYPIHEMVLLRGHGISRSHPCFYQVLDLISCPKPLCHLWHTVHKSGWNYPSPHTHILCNMTVAVVYSYNGRAEFQVLIYSLLWHRLRTQTLSFLLAKASYKLGLGFKTWRKRFPMLLGTTAGKNKEIGKPKLLV